MPHRRNRKYIPPDPEFKRLLSLLFNLYKFQHHGINWKNCPTSVVKKARALTQNICLPSPSQELIQDLSEVSSFVIEKLPEIAANHFHKTYCETLNSLSSQDFKDINPKRLLEALSVIKRWAKNTYSDINCDFFITICEELNSRYCHLNFKYQNGKFSVDKTGSPIKQDVSSFINAHTQTQDSGYVTQIEAPDLIHGSIVNHPPPVSYYDGNDYEDMILLRKKLDVLVIATEELLSASQDLIPPNWEIHCFEKDPGPDEVDGIIKSIDGIEPDNLIIDLKPTDLPPEYFSETLIDLTSYCRKRYLDTVHFTVYEVSAAMSENLRKNTLFHMEYLWNNHGIVIGPITSDISCSERCANSKILLWKSYMDKN